MKKKDITQKYNNMKQRKIYIGLLIIIGVAFVLGILFLAVLSKSNKDLVKSSLETFFTSIKQDKLDYMAGLFNSLKNTTGMNLFMWILGISIIGIPIIILMIFFKAFTLGFSLSSVIYFYGWKGIIIGLIYILPGLLSLFIFLVVGFYSISFSKHLFDMLFRKKEVYFKRITTRYLKVLGISTGVLVFSSILEIYLVPIILKTFVS